MPSAHCCNHLSDAAVDNFHEPRVRYLEDDAFDRAGVQGLLMAKKHGYDRVDHARLCVKPISGDTPVDPEKVSHLVANFFFYILVV